MTKIQEDLGEMSISEVYLINEIRKDSKEMWHNYGKSLEISLSIADSSSRPVLAKGQANVLKYMFAINKYKKHGTLSENLISLIKMKKSKYREALIEYGIWTEEIYLDIYNKYTDQKKLK